MSKRITLILAAFVAALVLVLASAQVASAGHWKQKWTRISGVAGETLATGDAVCIMADGLIWKADADLSTKRPAIGIVGDVYGVAGTTVEIVRSGIYTGKGTGNLTIDYARNGTLLKLDNTAGYWNSSGEGNQTLGQFQAGGDTVLVDVFFPAPAEPEY